MNFKPDEKDWMAYLYGELEGEESARMDQYIQDNPEAREELASFHQLRGLLRGVEDKEVIAPPIFVGDAKQRTFWSTPYFRTIISIAASVLLIILVGKVTGLQMGFSDNQFVIHFGEPLRPKVEETYDKPEPTLTAEDVQRMIDATVEKNNAQVSATLKESHQALQASIRQNLEANSGRIDNLMREVSLASQEQIRQYVANLQEQNNELVKEYFRLSTAEQKDYIEDILVDFAQYVQQQRANDLQVVQLELNNLKQNTDVFKYETEQILSTIISSVSNPESLMETKN